MLLTSADDSRLLLVLGRVSAKWSPPKGGLERGESTRVGAIRECCEETGLRVTIPETHPILTIRKQVYYCIRAQDAAITALPLEPWDVREVQEARWWTWEALAAIPTEQCNAITQELQKPAMRERIHAAAVVGHVEPAGPAPTPVINIPEFDE